MISNGPRIPRSCSTDGLKWAQYSWEVAPTDDLRWAQRYRWNTWSMISNGPGFLAAVVPLASNGSSVTGIIFGR